VRRAWTTGRGFTSKADRGEEGRVKEKWERSWGRKDTGRSKAGREMGATKDSLEGEA
jgi:hypothetical protein